MAENTAKQTVIKWLEAHSKPFTNMADEIWAAPEIKWYEFTASRLQADFLEKEGFSVNRDVAEMNTAFIAEWGEGKPVIGFIGEYDALPGLSQKIQPTKEPVEDGAPGHGCGHNLLGTGAVASAIAIQKWLQESGVSGTVRYYGCPAEEGGGGKVFMAREGHYDDLDAAFNYHPADINMPSKSSCVAIFSLFFRFTGRAAHAASAHLGRSALDAVELMNVGVNFLREHVKDSVRMHYVITNGGQAPNIVPEEAEVQYIIRAETSEYLLEVTDRVRKVAEGATLMTGTEVEENFIGGYSNMINNHRLADLQYEAMQLIGPIDFTTEEHAYAQQINDALPGSNSDYIDNWIEQYKPPVEISGLLDNYRDKALIEGNFPSIDQNFIEKGATDVGDLSQIVPVSMLYTTCFSTGSPGHSWSNVATGGMSIGHKGMMHAAKIMALAAVDLYTDPEKLRQVREEFEKKAKPYQCPIPEEIKPPRYEPVN
jgi:aminobenzoyl-glutamate utilization protein B